MSIFDTLSGIRKTNDVINKSNVSIWKGLENIFTGNLDYQRQLELQEKQQDFNAREAQKAREWNERLANTAYQRQSQDLKAAGFNPALMLSGSGAGGYTSAAASSSSGTSSGSGTGWKMLARIGLLLATQSMSALNYSVKANSNLTKSVMPLTNSRDFSLKEYIKAAKLVNDIKKL